MEQTELKLVENGACCGGTACDAETQAKFEAEQVEKERIMAEQVAASQPKAEVTKEMIIANVMELSMLVNRLQGELGNFANGVQNSMGEMYKAFMTQMDELKKSINP